MWKYTQKFWKYRTRSKVCPLKLHSTLSPNSEVGTHSNGAGSLNVRAQLFSNRAPPPLLFTAHTRLTMSVIFYIYSRWGFHVTQQYNHHNNVNIQGDNQDDPQLFSGALSQSSVRQCSLHLDLCWSQYSSANYWQTSSAIPGKLFDTFNRKNPLFLIVGRTVTTVQRVSLAM